MQMGDYPLNVFLQKVVFFARVPDTTYYCNNIVPTVFSTKDANINDTITGGQLVTSSENKLRGMVAEMNQTLKELSGSVTDANENPNTNQVANVTV